MIYKFSISAFCSLLFVVTLSAQESVIKLNNPSFEDDFPRHSRIVDGWYDCGAVNFPEESAPDIHPSPNPMDAFSVIKVPFDGDTYVGLVVRDNDSWESISQRLKSPLEKNSCYSFSLNLARSRFYQSRSRVTGKAENYSQPIIVRIWGGNGYCNRKERLAETRLITNYDWEQFNLKFEPKQKITHIIIEAFYKTPVLFPYNGNVLVDNASDIMLIPCDEESPLVKAKLPDVKFTKPAGGSIVVEKEKYIVKAKLKNVDDRKDIRFTINGKRNNSYSFNKRSKEFRANLKLNNGENTLVLKGQNEAGADLDEALIIYEKQLLVSNPTKPPTKPTKTEPKPPKRNAPKFIPELKDDKELVEGQSIPINKLYFTADSFRLRTQTYPIVDEIYEFLREYKDIVIEVGGHTNNRCDDDHCNKLSSKRAKAVADYLIKKGIEPKRLQFKGYGKHRPLMTNRTREGRKKNQRVEIKILKLHG